jgi:hypothetical protein
MSAYQAARAAEILGLESLPDRLTVEEIATLQVRDDQLPELLGKIFRVLERSPVADTWRRSAAPLAGAAWLRALQRAFVADTWCKAMRAAIDAGELRQADGKITAADFKRWLDVQGDSPSLLIESWFALHARGRKATGRREWTDEELAELRAFRDEHGTKAAAKKFGISEARIRQLLPTEKPPRKSHLALLELGKRTTMRGRKA